MVKIDDTRMCNIHNQLCTDTVDCKLVDQLQVQNSKSLNHSHEFHYLIS